MKRLLILALLFTASLSAADMSIWIQDTTPSTATQGTSIATVYLLTNGSAYCFSNLNSFTWYISAGSLPPGITLTGSGGGASMNGTPTSSGSFTFTIRVIDNCDSSSLTAVHTIVVGANSLPTGVAGSGLPTAPNVWSNVVMTWQDLNGWSNIVDMVVSIGTGGAHLCLFTIDPGGSISLYNDADTAYTSGTMGVGGVLTRVGCQIDSAGSSFTVKSGNQITASIRLLLTPSFGSPAMIYIMANDSIGPGPTAGPFGTTVVSSSKPFLIVTTYH